MREFASKSALTRGADEAGVEAVGPGFSRCPTVVCPAELDIRAQWQ